MYTYIKYSEIDSVKNDFLFVQDELVNCREINLGDFSVQYGDYQIDYHDDGRFEIAQEGYYDEEDIHFFDVSDLEGAEELSEYFDTVVKPFLTKYEN